jgi:hypothetical protein
MRDSAGSGSTAKDLAAFFIACAAGVVTRYLLPQAEWALYLSILVSYHLFLAWLLVTAEQEVGFALSIVSTTITHLAFLGCAFAFLWAGQYVPILGYLGVGISALAIFERRWLFVKTDTREAPAFKPVFSSTAIDYEEWMKAAARRTSLPITGGAALKAEYEQWLQTYVKSHAATSGD